MRESRKTRMARAAGLGTLVMGSMLLVQGRPALAQPPSNAGDAPVVPRSSAIVGQSGQADSDRDFRMVIAHGLDMAIEGSNLQGLARRASGVGLGQGVDPRPSLAGVVGSSSVGQSGVAVADPAALKVQVPPSSAGTGFTGGAGETVSGRVVGNGGDIRIGTGQPPAPVATSSPGLPADSSVTPSVPLTAADSSAMLRRQAMRSFEAGERLLGQAGTVAGPERRLQQAASRYLATLKAIANEPVVRPTTGVTPPAQGRAAEAIGADPASVALINHGVREAIGALRIRQMVRQSGGTSGPAGMQLMEHAQMMETEGRSMIRAFAGNGDAGAVPTASGIVGSPNGMVQALAQQASDLIAAMQGLNP